MGKSKAKDRGPLESAREQLDIMADPVPTVSDGTLERVANIVDPKTSLAGNGKRTPRNVEYLVLGTDIEGAEIVLATFTTLHQLRKYYLPLSGAFRHSYRNVRWLKARDVTGG